MHSFRNLAKALFSSPQASQADAELTLARAYQAVFLGNPKSDQQALVLVDLAEFTGFYRVTPPVGDTSMVFFNEGMRGAYGRIFRYLRMSADEIVALETAARETAALRNLDTNQQ